MCENEKKKYHSIEMTTGSLWKNILLFSLPLMGSQVLEVLFNLSDVAVVGRFADYMALGAVGSTTLLVTLFTGILIGMGAGVNVRVAHELGAGNKKGTEVEEAVQSMQRIHTEKKVKAEWQRAIWDRPEKEVPA